VWTATSAIDMSADQVFDITVQMGSAGAANYVFKTFTKQNTGRN
jgi:hypothetical protein